MKKSELKNFIREEIMSTLSEDIEDDIKALDAYDAKLDDVIKKKEEAGIEEKVAKSVKIYSAASLITGVIFANLFSPK